jgi:ribosome-associated protein
LRLEPREKALQVAQAALDRRGEELAVLDMRDLMTICDYFVICSGRSRLHAEAVAEEIEEQMVAEGVRAKHREGIPDASWVILDFLDVVVHIFTPEARKFYDLEGLWGDAPRLELPEPQGNC